MPRQTIEGRYELEQPLGGGAMGAVWLAHDRELDRRVAVKLLAPDADRTRFEREAHAVAALAHPNIVQLFDYGEAEQGPYMVLEYLPGGTLEDRLAGGRALPDDEAMRIAQEVAAGLAHAHERGLVHRDLKPANILFDAEGRAKIADFGIARIEGGNELTVAGTVLGTAATISPEQASGEQATPASDVYSFGVILFRMLTGRTPFVSDSAMELVRMHQQEQPPRVEELRPDAPPTLAALTAAALAKDPTRRPPDGSALLATLTGAGEDATMLLPPASAEMDATQVVPTLRPRRRQRRLVPLAAAGAAALALVGVAAAVLLTQSDPGSGAPPTSVPSLTLPTVGRETTTPSSTATTTASTAPARSTSTTSSTTSTAQATTVPTTTNAVTTAPPPPLTTTTIPTTAPATTTAPPPPTTTAPTTTAATTTAPAVATTTTTP